MSNFRNIITILLLLFLPTLVVAEVSIEGTWIREAPPVSRVQAAYGIFKNSLAHDVEIISATSPAFERIEFHETILENGLSKMQQLTSIRIPSQGKATLQPEGMHMMLFNPISPVRAGNKINIHFKFRNGYTTSSLFIVKKATGIDHHQHMHH